MAKKQALAKENAAAAVPARAANPKTPRVRAAQHSKVVHTADAAPSNSENPQEAIARIAYGFWESRGYQGGTPIEDWVRAEHEYRQRLAATRL